MSRELDELTRKIKKKGKHSDEYYLELEKEAHEYLRGDYPEEEKQRFRFGWLEALEMICAGIRYESERRQDD